MPPLSRHQRKEEFIKKLGSNVIKGYKHKRLKSLPQTTNDIEVKTSILDNADMEIEDDVVVDENVVFTRPPPPPEPANDIKPPPPPNDATTSATNEEGSSVTNKRTCSPTLDYLEDRKQKLLAELKSGLCDVDSLSSSATEESLNLETSYNETNTNEIHSVEPATPTTNETTRTLDIIKESHMGTPVLHFSPYEKLPAGDNFKIGVSDVINFENLPDSTGKYEQMKEVIKKVRNIVTKLHNDDDE